MVCIIFRQRKSSGDVEHIERQIRSKRMRRQNSERYTELPDKRGAHYIDDNDDTIEFTPSHTPRNTRSSSNIAHMNDNNATNTEQRSMLGAEQDEYDYIDTVNEASARGSHVVGTEVGPSDADITVSTVTQKTRDYENLNTPQNSNTQENSTLKNSNQKLESNPSDNLLECTDDSVNLPQEANQSDPTECVQNALQDASVASFGVVPTKENGYGKGAIPKRPTDKYYQLWGNKT